MSNYDSSMDIKNLQSRNDPYFSKYQLTNSTMNKTKEYLDTDPNELSLFERLGGIEACTAVVEGFYARIFNDPDLADFFRITDKCHQIDRMVSFIVFTTGGKSDWEGKSMKECHQGRGIGQEEFEKMVDHVRQTMRELGVMKDLIDELIEALDLLKPAYLDRD
eukprot:403338034